MADNRRETTALGEEIPAEAVGRDRQPVVEGGGADGEEHGHFVNSGASEDDAGEISQSQEKHSRATGAQNEG